MLPHYNEKISFTLRCKYLGSIITIQLNEDTEIEAQIQKVKSIMGLTKHIFECRDVDIRVKYQIYTAVDRLWMQSMEHVRKEQKETSKQSSHLHQTNAKKQMGSSQSTTNKKTCMRELFCNIPNIEAFVER